MLEIKKLETYIELVKKGCTDEAKYIITENKHVLSCMGSKGLKWKRTAKSEKELIVELNKKINEYGYESFEVHNNY